MDTQFRGWNERGYIPHRDAPGLTQFVTFHLADSFPATLRNEWAHMLEVKVNAEKRKQLERYLDQSRGACSLRRPDIAALVEDNFRQFSDGKRYELRAWVIMPNHVHVLFMTGSTPMSETIRSWKSNTARIANRMLGRSGAFWAEEYYDTYMRDSEHEQRTIRYIENNPVKANLVISPEHGRGVVLGFGMNMVV